MTPYFQDDSVTIYHGDCREVLPTLAPADCLLTDPPYGIGEAKANNRSRSKIAASRDYGRSDWDNAPPSRWLFDWLIEMTCWQIVWGGNYFGLPPSSCWLVWDKDNGANDFADCELAWTNLPKAVRRLVWRWHGMRQEPGMPKEDRVHPTQKPVAVMKWALSHVPQDCKTVLDPFMGSGTTLVAAKQLNRRAIGIEIEERYCELAVKRLAQEVLALA